MIANIDDMVFRNAFDLGKIHQHAVIGFARRLHDIAGQGDFQHITMTMQIAALTTVFRNTMPSELQLTGNANYGIPMYLWVCRLSRHCGCCMQY